MHSRLYKPLAAAAVLMATSGCVQATRHSNTMVFGTNTSLGLKVGNDANQVPSILVGYDRQEAVIMPLLANTREKAGSSDNLLSPCRVDEEVKILDAGGGAEKAKFAVHPCLFAATNGSATDSYSVLASFGAKFDAEVGTGTKAGGGLAQYFATGLAAQILATTGGAAVINTNAEESSPAAAAAVGDLFGTPAQRAQSAAYATSYQKFKKNLRSVIFADPDDATMLTRLKKFESGTGAKSTLSALCQTKANCLTILDDDQTSVFANLYRIKGEALDTQLTKWTD
jgi:hypothetical protein